MTYCDAMNAYGNYADWASHGVLLLLGVWKLVNLGAQVTKWAHKKI